MQVLTLDFHNTLANCDPWFNLEVRGLPWAVIERHDPGHELDRVQIDAAYRTLREQVIASGNEIDAYDGVSQILAGFHITLPTARIMSLVDEIMAECLDAAEPVPGSVDTVRTLYEAGVKLGVISSAVHHRTLEWVLERFGIADCFQAVVTSASCGFYKSSTSIYTAALGELGGAAASSVHIGDSLRWDVRTAREAGMSTAWLRTNRFDRFATAAETTIEPDLILDSMHNAHLPLLDLLERSRNLANA